MIIQLHSIQLNSNFNVTRSKYLTALACSVSVLALGIIFISTVQSISSDYVWTGAADTDYSKNENFNPTTAPVPGETIKRLIYWDGVDITNKPQLNSVVNIQKTTLIIGALGKNGSLDILDNGQLNVAFLGLGEDGGSNGVVTINGTNAKLEVDLFDLNTQIASYIGKSGTATLNVLKGSASLGNIIAADDAGSNATITVDGPDSSLNAGNAGYKFILANNGTGSLNISNSGKVTLNGAEFAKQVGSVANVFVDGTGSELGVGPIYDGVSYGVAGTANVTVRNGGKLFGNDLSFGTSGGGQGNLTVTGAGSTLTNSGKFSGNVSINNGTLNFNNQAQASGVGLSIASGVATIEGAGTIWDSKYHNSRSDIGVFNSTLNVLSGAKIISANDFFVGLASQTGAVLNVDGKGTEINSSFRFLIGGSEKTTVNVTNGAIITSAALSVSSVNNGEGKLTISGNGSVWNVVPRNVPNYENYLGRVDIGWAGTGIITLTDGGALHVADVIRFGREEGSGVLNIGAAQEAVAAGSGELTAKGIVFVSGSGIINFNHTNENYVFAPPISGSGTVNQIHGKTIFTGESTYTGSTTIAVGSTLQLGNAGNTGSIVTNVANEGTLAFNRSNELIYEGKITGTGLVDQIGSGRTVLTGDSSGLVGQSQVHAGILAVNGLLGGSMDVITGRLQGTGTVGSTSNEVGGTIAPGDGGFDKLTINGNYTGKGGTVEIATVLGDDSSQTNRLVITGDTSGTTTVVVNNQSGGLGAQTTEGIKIIDITGQSNGTFSLQSDYATKTGEKAVVAGAYAYTLHKNGVSTPTDGNWYLRSSMTSVTPPACEDTNTCPPTTPTTPRYNPGTPIYEGYANTMQALNKLPTLQQRVGNRSWSNAGNPVMEQGADALGTPLVSSGDAGIIVDQRGIWGRIEGAHNRLEANRSTTGMKQDIDTFIMQAGIDGQFTETEAGRLIGGFTAQYGKANSNITSAHGDGKIDTSGWGLGGTLTWYGDNGVYLDTQAQAMWYDSSLNSATVNKTLGDGNKGFGYGLSAEAGKRVDIDSYWSFTPQAQLTWSSVKFDTFNDAWGASVSNDNGDSLNARLGISADYRNAWRDGNGQIIRTNVYAIANLYQEFMGQNKVNVAGVNFDNANDKTWGGLGAGGTYAWADDKYALYGEVSLNTSLSNFADSYNVNGTAGFKVAF